MCDLAGRWDWPPSQILLLLKRKILTNSWMIMFATHLIICWHMSECWWIITYFSVSADLCCGCVCLFYQSCLTLCDTMDCSLPGFCVHKFSRQEYWSGLSCPPPGALPNPGIEPRSPALQTDYLSSETPRKYKVNQIHVYSSVFLLYIGAMCWNF